MKRKLLTITTVILGMAFAAQAQVLPSPPARARLQRVHLTKRE